MSISSSQSSPHSSSSPVEEFDSSYESKPIFNCYSPRNINKSHYDNKHSVIENNSSVTPTKRKSGEMKQLTLTPKGELDSVLDNDVKQKPRRRKKKDDNKKQSNVKDVAIDTLFPVLRRSERRCAKEIKEIVKKNVEDCVLNNVEDGLKVIQTDDRGRGVIATRTFFKDQFVVEYKGKLLDEVTARKQEAEYQKDTSIGCYMYYFVVNDTKYCVDATAESGYLGRLLNHSRSKPNCYTKSLLIDSKPYLVIFAKRDIDMGEELLYDYGERDKNTLEQHPWLKS